MIDRYTKIVLTVIAGALVALVAQNAVNATRAEELAPTRVQICGSFGSACADVDRGGALKVSQQ